MEIDNLATDRPAAGRRLRAAARTALVWAAAVLAAFLLRAYAVTVVRVADTGSMLPTLDGGDVLLVGRIGYRFSPPRAGDIVVAESPDADSPRFAKRVAAIPGDVVEFRGQAFWINGERLGDAFSDGPVVFGGDFGMQTAFGRQLEVPQGEFFLLGDNRNRSHDSRHSDFGTVPAERMTGRVFFRIWPPGRFGPVG